MRPHRKVTNPGVLLYPICFIPLATSVNMIRICLPAHQTGIRAGNRLKRLHIDYLSSQASRFEHEG